MTAALQQKLVLSLPSLFQRIDAFVFPPLCIVCDKPRQTDNRWLCGDCLRQLIAGITSRDGCPHCGQNRAVRSCTCAVVWDYPFDRIVSFVDYGDTAQAVMHHVKYQGKRHLARYMGQVCAPYLDKSITDGVDIVLPVPLHWLRRQQRGYNQAEWFARGLFEDVARPKVHCGILRRVRRTKTQTKLDKSDRRRNVAGAFALTVKGAAAVKGKSLLLVDDVITTGATTAAAAAVLLAGGSGSVTVVSFARD
ncbi:MAG: ComF family protein [Chitinispirillaceae bacterium]|nr:ComF family protein [Chitinispirillaceae bacterium]